MNNMLIIFLISIFGSGISLAGGIILISKKSWSKLLSKYAIPFSVGAILAVVLFDLLPESFEQLPVQNARWLVIAGLLGTFLIERFMHKFHHHEHGRMTTEKSIPIGLIITGDLMHNILDGIAIGVAFLVSLPTGLVTTIAVAAHEVPREIGDFGLMLKAGFKSKNVIVINVLIALTSIASILLTYAFGPKLTNQVSSFLAVAAGAFIYIAVFELLPLTYKEFRQKPKLLASIWMIIGLLTVALAGQIGDILL